MGVMSVKKLIAGKHNCVGHLSAPAAAVSPGSVHFERPAMLVYAGKFESMDGPVEVTEEHIDRLVASHNARVDSAQLAGNEEAFVRMMPPLQLDHSTSAKDTVGRVVGKLSKGVHQTKDGEFPALMADKVRVLGAENIEKVKDGRWANVSIGADLEKGELNELSITPFPAAPSATLLAKMGTIEVRGKDADITYQAPQGYYVIWHSGGAGKKEGPFDTLNEAKEHVAISGKRLSEGSNMAKAVYTGSRYTIKQDGDQFIITVGGVQKGGYFNSLKQAVDQADQWVAQKKLSEGNPDMHEKLKQHLMGHHKMSADQAEEHMGKLKEHLKKHLGLDDDGADKHLAGLEPEHADKMAAAMSAGDHLSDDIKETDKKLKAAKPQLALLSKGLSKELKQTQLAAKTASLSSKLSRLRAQAKVSPAELKKLDVAKLAALPEAALAERLKSYEEREPVIDPRVHGTTRAIDVAKLKAATDKIRLTAETKKDLGHTLTGQEEKVLAGEPAAVVHIDTNEHEHQDEYMKKLHAMLADHPAKDAVLAHVGEMLKHHLAGPAEHAVHDEKQMSALAENFNRLQNQFDGFVKMVGEATGLSAAELTE